MSELEWDSAIYREARQPLIEALRQIAEYRYMTPNTTLGRGAAHAQAVAAMREIASKALSDERKTDGGS